MNNIKGRPSIRTDRSSTRSPILLRKAASPKSYEYDDAAGNEDTTNSMDSDQSDFVEESYGSSKSSKFQNESNRKLGDITNERKGESPANGGKVWKLLFFVMMIVIAALISRQGFLAPQVQPERTCSFRELEHKYPNQSKSVWIRLSVGIENIINKRSKQAGVYLFVHQGEPGTDDVIKDIAAYSANCFSKDMNVVEMSSDDFTSKRVIDDYGHAVEMFKEKIEKGKVVLVVNLNKIPAESARALHSICDTHSPIADDVVVFLTLITPPGGGNVKQRVADTLFQLWGAKMESYELDPLITRVSDEIILLVN